MWQTLLNLATIAMGAAAAVSVAETISKGGSRRAMRKQLKRGMILPREAARELERQIGGRVAVGRDLDGYLLIVIRTPSGVAIPAEYAGYRVKRKPKL